MFNNNIIIIYNKINNTNTVTWSPNINTMNSSLSNTLWSSADTSSKINQNWNYVYQREHSGDSINEMDM